MDDAPPSTDRVYFAQRAAEELELALTATDKDAEEAHRRMQRVYLERACIGSREGAPTKEIG